MIKKNKYLLFFFCILYLLYSNFVLALEVSDYPNIPGFSKPTEGNLATYVSYLFGFMCYIAGAMALISFAIGAVQLIMSASNPSNVNEAKDRMKGSVLGLVLTLSAVLILKTINPQLIEIVTTALPETDGLYYTNGTNFISAPTSEANTANIKTGYETLSYKCSSGPILLIWKYPKTNFAGTDANYSGVKVVRKKCGETESLSGIKSFETSFETPGIYYCLGSCSESGTVCSGYMSKATASGGTLASPFKKNFKSLRIVNDIPGDMHYGVIFHDTDDASIKSICSETIYSSNKNKEVQCFNNDFSLASSSTIFYWNDKDYEKSGTGVNFYSEPFGWANGARAGKNSANNNFIKDFWTGQASNLTFSYTGITRPSEYYKLYQNFQQRSGSIKVNGNYLLILRSGSYCQVFFKDVVNLKSTEITATGVLDKIDIIPVK